MKTKLILTLTACFLLLAADLIGQSAGKTRGSQEVFGDEKISIPEAYVFELSVVMELKTNEPGEEESSMKYRMRYQMNNAAMAMIPLEIDGRKPEDDLKVVVDFEMQRMINFVDSEYSKMGMVYPLADARIASKSDLNPATTQFKKTGRKKVLFDLECEEYTLRSPDLNGTLWIAPDLEINLTKSFQALGLQIQTGDLGSDAQPRGFIMEFETTSEKGVTSNMKVVDLNLDDYFELNTEGYAFSVVPVVDEEDHEIDSESYPEDSKINEEAIKKAK
jgi:hypothetical protein